MIADNYNFENALSALKNGHMVARNGWNGKGMFIYMVKGRLVEHENFYNEAKKAVLLAYDIEGNKEHNPSSRLINDHIDMKTADGSITIGWSPSQSDLFAEDWIVLK